MSESEDQKPVEGAADSTTSTPPQDAANANAEANSEQKGSTEAGDAGTDPLVAAKAEANEYRDRMLRLAADFDNYKKRSARERTDAEKAARESILRELLPVFDNLERAALHANQATDAKAVADGVGMVLRQFQDSIERAGIKRVQTIGKPFDPSVHEAIQQIPTAEHPVGAVIAEVQAGYQFTEAFGGRLIRAAMVVVAKAPEN